MDSINLKKLSEVEGKQECQVEVPNRFVPLEKLDSVLHINRAWETIRISKLQLKRV
jgi:hypothetical protein